MNPVESGVFKDDWQKIPKEQFIDNSRYLLVIAALGVLTVIVSIGVYAWALIASYLMTVPVVLGIVIIAQYAVASHFPVFLMGRYRPGLYKEKLVGGVPCKPERPLPDAEVWHRGSVDVGELAGIWDSPWGG